jgi:purine-binding chemotaxis protein CheW
MRDPAPSDPVRPPSAVQPGATQFATFSIGDLFFGIDVLNVQEVLRHQEMTRVPLAPGAIRGLINLRGQIVTAVDMRGRLELPALDRSENSMNMVVRTQGGAVSLLVDEIGDVLAVDEASYEPPPDNLSPVARNLIRGIFKLKDRLLLVLDTERAVDGGQAF